MIRPIAFTVLFWLFGWSAAFTQTPSDSPSDPAEDSILRIFLDCDACDFNFLREQIPYVHFVRDPEQADLHILITSQRTGNNANSFQLDFLGRKAFQGQDRRLSFSEVPNATDDYRRRGIARQMELGLIPYWLDTPLAETMQVEVKTGAATPQAVNKADPWDRWVFQIGGGGSYDKEASRRAFNVWGNVRADRVTEDWRIRNNFYLRYDERLFKDADGDIVSTIQRKYAESQIVRSLGPHWSAGAFLGVNQSTFDNLDLGAYLAPAVEFSIFPYKEVNRRELTISYRINYLHRNYHELTIYQKTGENLLTHALEFRARVRQPWGSLFAGVEGSHFLQDIRQHRLEVNGSLELRIVKGLSLDIGGEMAFIKDQRSLPAGGASLEDLLLAQRQLATNYLFSGYIGLRYIFGSIYNDVVNTRL